MGRGRNKKSTALCVLGTGSRLRGDDGAGCVLAERLAESGLSSFDCATVPENFTGKVKSLAPETVVIFDACRMGTAPGRFRIVDKEQIECGDGFSSHSPSLYRLILYLEEFIKNVIFIGIEPENTSLGEGLSPVVEEAVCRLAEIIKEGELFRIEKL